MAAIEDGCRKLVIGLGGSATNDGGIGLAQAMGVSFLDEGRPGAGFLAAGSCRNWLKSMFHG